MYIFCHCNFVVFFDGDECSGSKFGIPLHVSKFRTKDVEKSDVAGKTAFLRMRCTGTQKHAHTTHCAPARECQSYMNLRARTSRLCGLLSAISYHIHHFVVDTPTPSLRHARTPVLDGRASADTNRARLGARRCGAHGSGIAHTTRTCTCLRVRMRTHAPLPARRLRQIEGAHHLLVRQLLSQLCGARDLGDRLVPASDCTLH